MKFDARKQANALLDEWFDPSSTQAALLAEPLAVALTEARESGRKAGLEEAKSEVLKGKGRTCECDGCWARHLIAEDLEMRLAWTAEQAAVHDGLLGKDDA